MCDLVYCHGEGTMCLQFHGICAQLCFSNARVPVGKIFDSQTVRVAQTPCKQFLLNQKMMSMDCTLDLLIRAFFGRGDWEVCHSELCLLVVRSYSKTQVSSMVITRCRKWAHLSHDPRVPEKPTHDCLLFIRQILWDQFRTNFSHVQIFRND